VTRARMAEMQSGGTWGSALTADEFAAIRGAGFEAAGQVFGAAVHAAVSATGAVCPGAWRSPGGGLEPFRPLARAMYQARQAAIGRMADECVQLGGHGVVGVRLSDAVLPFGGLQFTAIGTAVRAPGAAAPRAPFTADVSGQDFAKLISTGWVPVGIAQGISIGARHDDWTTARQARWNFRNAEVTGWTELVSQCRHDARGQLAADVGRLGAEGVVLTAMRMRVSGRDCPVTVGQHDHVVEAIVTGTAIVSFPLAGERAAGLSSLVVMSLDPQRRQAARIRI
jgi:uncharacterized protein YbjQ (UPF0145 family)